MCPEGRVLLNKCSPTNLHRTHHFPSNPHRTSTPYRDTVKRHPNPVSTTQTEIWSYVVCRHDSWLKQHLYGMTYGFSSWYNSNTFYINCPRCLGIHCKQSMTTEHHKYLLRNVHMIKSVLSWRQNWLCFIKHDMILNTTHPALHSHVNTIDLERSHDIFNQKM